jgi:hypothetical protein
MTHRPTKLELLARIEALEARVRTLEINPPRTDASAIVDNALNPAAVVEGCAV